MPLWHYMLIGCTAVVILCLSRAYAANNGDTQLAAKRGFAFVTYDHAAIGCGAVTMEYATEVVSQRGRVLTTANQRL